jgi:hypothetical protein
VASSFLFKDWHDDWSYLFLQERIRSLTDTRKALIDENWDPSTGGKSGGQQKGAEDATSKMVEEERRRLEVAKRRGEKELQQVRKLI